MDGMGGAVKGRQAIGHLASALFFPSYNLLDWD